MVQVVDILRDKLWYVSQSLNRRNAVMRPIRLCNPYRWKPKIRPRKVPLSSQVSLFRRIRKLVIKNRPVGLVNRIMPILSTVGCDAGIHRDSSSRHDERFAFRSGEKLRDDLSSMSEAVFDRRTRGLFRMEGIDILMIDLYVYGGR